ncbi:MAG: hypothetical protein CMJ54_03060 [Planctomycetaceae bacterium]|nr:hypothetical protein [Planctomycetaceae bacterium]MAB71468.1 hypothetical protein [Planctomycetaceae bacterium]
MRFTDGFRFLPHLAILFTSLLLLPGCDREATPAAAPKDGGVGVIGERVTMDDDPVVTKFRTEAAGYLEMRAILGDLNRRMAAGNATAEEVEQWRDLQEKCDRERVRLNAILYADSTGPDRRRAMFWILQSAN